MLVEKEVVLVVLAERKSLMRSAVKPVLPQPGQAGSPDQEQAVPLMLPLQVLAG